MGREILSKELSESNNPVQEGFKDIKPSGNTTYGEAVEHWRNEFTGTEKLQYDKTDSEQEGYYTAYEDRIKHTPAEDTGRGIYEGERGESMFVPSETTEEGKAAKEKLTEYGVDGIEYKNGEPDFSKTCETSVKIDNMTENRANYTNTDGEICSGNFEQADQKCAGQWNECKKDGKDNWTARDVASWRKENGFSWHERCDMKTMDLVSRDIHDYFGHSGGCKECSMRDHGDLGGDFDE